MTRARPAIALLAASLVLADGTASQALTWAGQRAYVMGLEASTTAIALHPFGGGFALTSPDRAPEELIAQALRDRMSNPLLGLTATPSPLALGLTTGTRSIDFGFHVAGVPVCRVQARAHVRVNGEAVVLGTLPQVDANEPPPPASPSDWPDLELALRHAAAAVEDASHVKLKSATRCFHVRSGHLMHAYDLLLSVDGLPWTALADGYEVFALAKGYFDAFDVNGTAKVHPNNVLKGSPTAVKLKGLIGDGTLTSEYIKTVVPSGTTPAKEESHAFNYPPLSDPRYDEAAVFHYAQRHLSFVQSLGFAWYGPTPLLVKLHVKPAGRSNNALFVPAMDADDNPTISIDDGDGVELQKLALDADVISHELGHHVVFETLKKTDGEALVLHEGLADFFLFARADDPCLGESICPEGSNACIMEAQCLRSGALDLRYGDDDWKSWAGSLNRLGHLHSQVISGMLWDVRRDGLMSVTDLAKLVLRAISLLNEDSGFADFLAALVAADEELHAGQHVAKLKGAAVARGLEGFLTGGAIDPGDGTDTGSAPPATGGNTPAAGATTDTATATSTATSTSTAAGAASKGGSSDKDKRLPLCGVAGNADGQQSAAILLVLLAVLAPALWPAHSSSRIRAWLSAPRPRWRPRSTRRRPPL